MKLLSLFRKFQQFQNKKLELPQKVQLMESSPAAEKPIEQPTAELDFSERTSIVTMNQSARATKTLEISLRSIFNKPEFEPIIVELMRHLKQTGNDDNYTQIYRESNVYLTQVIEREVPDRARNPLTRDRLLEGVQSEVGNTSRNALLLAAQNRLHQHFVQTNEALYAYNPNVKPNPQAVFYPDPTTGKSLFAELPFAKKLSLIKPDTVFSAAGDSVAVAITDFLQAKEYAVQSFKSVLNAPMSASRFSQLIEYAFNLPGAVPFNPGLAVRGENRQELRSFLLTAKMFFLSLTSAEVGSSSKEDQAEAGQLLSVEENVRALQKLLNTWRSFNPELKLIVSVSPVPLASVPAKESEHIVSFSSHVKAILRVAAEEFAKQNPESVFYFPAFDAVMYSTEKPLRGDCRQISQESELKLSRLFEQMYLATAV